MKKISVDILCNGCSYTAGRKKWWNTMCPDSKADVPLENYPRVDDLNNNYSWVHYLPKQTYNIAQNGSGIEFLRVKNSLMRHSLY